MVNSANDYAAYRPQVKKPRTVEPYKSNYDLTDPSEIHRYAKDLEEYARWKEGDAEVLEMIEMYEESLNEGYEKFCYDLFQDDIDAGIPIEACQEAWDFADLHADGYAAIEDLYIILIKVAYKALKIPFIKRKHVK